MVGSRTYIFILSVVLHLVLAAEGNVLVDPMVHNAMNQKGTADIFLNFHGPKPSEVMADYCETYPAAERHLQPDVLPEMLRSNAWQCQSRVWEILRTEAPNLVWKYLWISNQVVVKQVNSDLLERLSAQEDIAGIEADVILKLIESPQLLTGVLQPEQIQWGVEHIGAPTIWNTGLLGQGVVVGNIDSGVRRSHLTLKNNHRSDHGWYDAIHEQPEPYDDNGHGTHTMATLAGQFGVGVAPNASWIACKAFDENGSATASDIIACGQWIMCPTDPEGKNPDCSKRPKVVSNSWGGSDTGSGFFQNVMDAWTSAGMVIVFSAGNAGPECNTTDSPGSSTKAIAVGALDIENVVAPFSSRGPAYNGNLKPDVSAPGVQVVSADFNSDDGIVAFSGTSMAAPHVAGIAALLCSRSPFLMQEDVRKYLVQSARKTKPVGETCGGILDDIYPNNIVGYGGVSAPGAMHRLLRDLEAQKYNGHPN